LPAAHFAPASSKRLLSGEKFGPAAVGKNGERATQPGRIMVEVLLGSQLVGLVQRIDRLAGIAAGEMPARLLDKRRDPRGGILRIRRARSGRRRLGHYEDLF
jgi:hypothetical protein